jgi:tripartite-type tricarboxylate transporter receptor subunit TctC
MGPDIPFIVPFGRDGASDRAAWAYVDRLEHPATSPRAALLRAALPQKPGGGKAARVLSPTLLIENHPGSGGLLGIQRATAIAKGGGPVLLLGTPSTHILLPARSGKEAILDPAFRAIAELASAPNVLLVSPKLGVTNLAQFIDRAKAERLTYASAGAGQTVHVSAAYFCSLAGITMSHRPYAESTLPYEDLIAGRVHAYFDNLLGCRDHIQRGEVVPLAVSAATRAGEIPVVPTLEECGFPQHALDVWMAVFGANLDEAVLQALGASWQAATALSDRIERSRGPWLRALEATPDLRA